eukprot:5579501-Pyramimonas_sp.AAC.1
MSGGEEAARSGRTAHRQAPEETTPPPCDATGSMTRARASRRYWLLTPLDGRADRNLHAAPCAKLNGPGKR